MKLIGQILKNLSFFTDKPALESQRHHAIRIDLSRDDAAAFQPHADVLPGNPGAEGVPRGGDIKTRTLCHQLDSGAGGKDRRHPDHGQAEGFTRQAVPR